MKSIRDQFKSHPALAATLAARRGLGPDVPSDIRMCPRCLSAFRGTHILCDICFEHILNRIRTPLLAKYPLEMDV